MKISKTDLTMGDVVVMTGAIGGPAMRVTGFGYACTGTCQGSTATLEALRRHDEDETRPAWRAEFLVADLRALPDGHPATGSPFYDFGVGSRNPSE